jgi:hypothetical protein
MGLSSKKTKTSSKETLAPSTYSQPYIDQAVQGVNAGAQQSQDLLNKYLPQGEKSLSYFGDVMGGKYLDQGNPYLQGMIDQTNESVGNQVDSRFSAAGRYGSDYNVGELARQLSNSENNLRYGNYATERGYQNNAALGNLAGIESLAGMPSQFANNQANAINSLVGKYVTSTGNSTTKQSGSIMDMLAQAAQVAAMASDIRLKTNVERVGEFEDGLGIYDFDYLPIEGQIAAFMPEGRQRGVMAHEVAVLRPDALGPVIDGYTTVNYGAL